MKNETTFFFPQPYYQTKAQENTRLDEIVKFYCGVSKETCLKFRHRIKAPPFFFPPFLSTLEKKRLLLALLLHGPERNENNFQ